VSGQHVKRRPSRLDGNDEKGLEPDLGNAQHVGVGRAAGVVFAQELGEDAVFVVERFWTLRKLGLRLRFCDMRKELLAYRRKSIFASAGKARPEDEHQPNEL